ncbi:MAG: helix-turn-helix domain-containing protein [bacterium]
MGILEEISAKLDHLEERIDQLEEQVNHDGLKSLYSIEEAAERMKISESMVRKLINTGELEYCPVGTRKLISENAIQDYYSRKARRKTGQFNNKIRLESEVS